MFKRYLLDVGQALIALRRRPAIVIVAALVMAGGIGASTAIFNAVHAARFNPLLYPRPGTGNSGTSSCRRTGRSPC